MIDIPINPFRNSKEEDVEKAVAFVVEKMNTTHFKSYHYVQLMMNHARADEDELWVSNDCARKVAEIFKSKGYFCHYCTAMNGVHYALSICSYPSNNDI